MNPTDWEDAIKRHALETNSPITREVAGAVYARLRIIEHSTHAVLQALGQMLMGGERFTAGHLAKYLPQLATGGSMPKCDHKLTTCHGCAGMGRCPEWEGGFELTLYGGRIPYTSRYPRFLEHRRDLIRQGILEHHTWLKIDPTEPKPPRKLRPSCTKQAPMPPLKGEVKDTLLDLGYDGREPL